MQVSEAAQQFGRDIPDQTELQVTVEYPGAIPGDVSLAYQWVGADGTLYGGSIVLHANGTWSIQP